MNYKTHRRCGSEAATGRDRAGVGTANQTKDNCSGGGSTVAAERGGS
ncbi:MAG: hypothetical protein Q4D81_09035 [Eubacteriales bacterium]|nr:hypothetical protein [Eubacteriales bacterium]